MGKQLNAYSDGKCAKDESHTWKKEGQIYWHKTQDGKSILCNNQQCFELQGGKLGFSGGSPRARTTIEVRLEEATKSIEYAVKKLEDINKAIPELSASDKLVFVESITKTVMGNR